ncbi:NAD(P)H-binding protein [Microbacterium album]|uniref:NAD-dependent dehydratase n=1 Tax=Microbacterium album TaxID=2053191 RepID=A0A917IH37_9MICO|nr:NAD(P)H-binding protein [Microbacterium album]GGH46291.1 NAD-dependent dehydratase [Microbacterium album]
MADIIVIGGHGRVALRAAPLLREAGHSVTSVIRDAAQAADVETSGATPLVLDVERASVEDLADAFRGRDAIVWSAGAGGGNPARTWAVDRDAAIRAIDAAVAAGVARFVMVSYLGAGPDHGVPEDDSFFAYAEAKAAADAHLRASDLDWTILGPGSLTLDEPTGRIRLVAPGTDVSRGDHDRHVSRGNVARTIVAALEIPHTIHRTLEYVDGDTDIRDAFRGA